MIPRKRKHPKKSLVEESAEKAVARLDPNDKPAVSPGKYPLAVAFGWTDYPKWKRRL